MEYPQPSNLMADVKPPLVLEETPRLQRSVPGLPSLKSILRDAGNFPREALFLGLAEDGLPVLLNLYDPVPGPILVTGDRESGKTSLVQMIVRASGFLHDSSEVQFGVVTSRVEEWAGFKEHRTVAGIYDIEDGATAELLKSLVTWAHNNKGDRQSILLIIDGLEEAVKLTGESEQNLRWLLLRGPSRRVWPIVTMNAGNAVLMKEWMDFFRTRLFGHVSNPQDTQAVTGNAGKPLDNLTPGSQFSMREGADWLNLWLLA